VNHVCSTEPNNCESCCVMLSRLFLSYGVSCRAIGFESYEPVAVNHGVLCEASGCESWSVILSQWLLFMVGNAEQVIVNHGELC
jgi:hypothetical protein